MIPLGAAGGNHPIVMQISVLDNIWSSCGMLGIPSFVMYVRGADRAPQTTLPSATLFLA